ncbi:MAG: NAD(P)H-hydrate dehydratase [Opitutaceae bacterium]|jgi:NAD(P)H-hydrate epimerase
MISAHPILSCDQARELEARLFEGDELCEWAAMKLAGVSVAAAVLGDFREIGGFPSQGRILVLAGKGHNAGDALLAAQEIMRRHPAALVDVIFIFGELTLRPLASRAWRECLEAGRDRVKILRSKQLAQSASYDLCLDGIFGFQFRPPLDLRASAVLSWVAGLPIRLRAAVDLPSGLDAPGAFKADFTYATGSVKAPLLSCVNAGRSRYLDLGFFGDSERSGKQASRDFVLTREVLAPLAMLRPAQSDKRSFGHVFILGGSRFFPGAVLMSVLAALRSGVGLVTAFVPESLVSAYAARAPEAMWVGWPETPDGSLALEGISLLRHRLGKASSLVVGPGLGRDRETLALIESLVKTSEVPLVIDADALQPSVIKLGAAPRILTPHAGEYLRIANGAEPADFSKRRKATTLVLKGPMTCIAHGGVTYRSLFGGPVLARGGSGDILAGLIGGLLAQTPADTLGAASRGVAWHGLAADLLARAKGQVAVRTTDILDVLPEALRARGDE